MPLCAYVQLSYTPGWFCKDDIKFKMSLVRCVISLYLTIIGSQGSSIRARGVHTQDKALAVDFPLIQCLCGGRVLIVAASL